MPLTQNARDLIGKQMLGQQTSSQDWSSGNSYLHVGSSTATFTSTQNFLLSTGAVMKGLDAGYPTYSVTSGGAPVLTARATFTTSEANFDWNEWAWRNSSTTTTGDSMNRKQETLGTKASTQSWQLTTSISVTT